MNIHIVDEHGKSVSNAKLRTLTIYPRIPSHVKNIAMDCSYKSSDDGKIFIDEDRKFHLIVLIPHGGPMGYSYCYCIEAKGYQRRTWRNEEWSDFIKKKQVVLKKAESSKSCEFHPKDQNWCNSDLSETEPYLHCKDN